MDVVKEEETAESGSHKCTTCGEVFARRNGLFKHLRTHGVFPENEITYVRVALLVGWLSRSPEGDAREWIKDGSLTYGPSDGMQGDVEKHLWEAVKTAEGILPGDEHYARPKGLSRASACGACTTRLIVNSGLTSNYFLCDQLKNMHVRTFDSAWVDSVNSHLPDFVRVHEVFLMPRIGDFHAENSCTQRVYEYMFPMPTMMQDAGSNAAATTELLDYLRKNGLAEAPSGLSFVDDSFCVANDADVEGRRDTATGRSRRTGDWDTKRPRNKMDQMFHGAEESDFARKRITYFRNLKVLFKKFGGKHSFHNFAAGGACPDDSTTMRKVDRIYHKEVVEFADTETQRPEGVCAAAAIPVRAEGDYSNLWAVFSASGDSFLRGQIRHMIALAVCVMNKWLPVEYFTAAINEDTVLDVPSLQGYPLMLSECRYDRWEAKYYMRLDPRRVDGADCGRINSWKQVVRSHIAGHYNTATGRNERSLSALVLQNMQNDCKNMCLKYYSILALRNRVDLNQRLDTLKNAKGGAAVPAAYARVLRLLREADASGMWPASSMARSKYIANAPEDKKVDKSGKKIKKEKVLEPVVVAEEPEGVIGGSFSIGCYPKPLMEPKGNSLFPELLVACFQLERLIAPHRPPSSTIAVNRHAQFKPHRDSGAGNGQCKSLIVGLGDYVGGETVAESVPFDIRYNPVEFDGWSERHWTLPFEGERYSLVWFTPFGVEESDMFWLTDPMFLRND